MKHSIKYLMVLAIGIAFTTFGDEPSVDDFLRPVLDDPKKGKVAPTKPKQPDKVKKTTEKLTKDGEKTTVVEAANAQDAVVVAAMELEDGDDEIVILKLPGGGMGVMAVGSASYAAKGQRNARLIKKRNAYFQAYMKAKKNLAGYLHGMTVEGKEAFSDAMDNYDDDHKSLVSTQNMMNEAIVNKIEGLLRGHVIYSVNDDDEEGDVTVKIVTTPMTRGETMRATPGLLMADSIQNGYTEVIAELKSKVLPPVGGRVICVIDENDDQHYWFFGFGCEIVRSHDRKDIQKKLKANAKNRALKRASRSLIGIINAEQTVWAGGMTDDTEEAYKDAGWKDLNDPIQDNKDNPAPADQAYETFKNMAHTLDCYKFAVKGELPPGIAPKTWFSTDGDWAFATYTFNANMTLSAKQLSKQIKEGPSILQRGEEIAGKKRPTQGVYKDKEVVAPLGQGPSGVIGLPEDSIIRRPKKK